MFKTVTKNELFRGDDGNEYFDITIVDTVFVHKEVVSRECFWYYLSELISKLYISRGYSVAFNLSRFYSFRIRNGGRGVRARDVWVPAPYKKCVLRRLLAEFGELENNAERAAFV